MKTLSNQGGNDPGGIKESRRGPQCCDDPRNAEISREAATARSCGRQSADPRFDQSRKPRSGDRTCLYCLRIASLWALVMLLSGCVSPGYDYGSRAVTENDLPPRDDEEQIERGRPVPIIDGIGWVVGIPSKVMLLSTRVDNHFVSHATEQSLQEYLDANELDRVKVRLNQYAPLDEWRRLRGNKSVSPGWRYTLGTLATLGYTVLPGRILGGDNYNPFTNTINIYSDHPAIALHEAGHAKDFSQRTYKGTWAAAYLLPGVALRHEEIATSDALSYLASEGRTDEQQAAYKILYPAYGSHVAGQISNLVPSPNSLIVTAACVVPGHLIGRWKASQIEPAAQEIEPARAIEVDTAQATPVTQVPMTKVSR